MLVPNFVHIDKTVLAKLNEICIFPLLCPLGSNHSCYFNFIIPEEFEHFFAYIEGLLDEPGKLLITEGEKT